MPPSNAYLSLENLKQPEKTYPLRVFACPQCWLVQTEDYAVREELFQSDYAYFSSTSTSWIFHAQKFSTEIISKLKLGKNSFVVEVACNDGYLLKNFIAKDIPCLGIEPTASTAAAAERLGIPVLQEFFGESLAKLLGEKNRKADLIIGNNVYAHVPDIVDFTRGLAVLLKAEGIVILEFPHFLRLFQGIQFDTVYHEHFSYFSLHTVSRIFHASGLSLWDVEELPTHGGSLRVYGSLASTNHRINPKVMEILKKEKDAGLMNPEKYLAFQLKVDRVKSELLRHLGNCARAGRKVVGYGAAAKGNTLLNFAGVKKDLLEYVCDAAPSKQGKFLPGSHIPIFSPKTLLKDVPDEILILPWNIADEISQQLIQVTRKGARLFTAIPRLKYL